VQVASIDVAVVGAGPAGAWAAYTLARAGARVTIIDPSHPREKPCGGGVTGRALALVAEAIAPARLPITPIRRARFVDASAGQAAVVGLGTSDDEGVDSGGPDALVVASRASFDAALVSAACRAGATLLPARARRVATNGRGASVETTAGVLHAGFLIGADGASSLVRRQLTRPFARHELSLASGYFAHGVTSDEIVVDLTADASGYLWSFPRPTHLAIGLCTEAARGTSADLRARVSSWIHRMQIAHGARLEPYSWPIPSLDPGALRRLELAGPGWCLVGDAAGLVDPITREGIYYALVSGMCAAEAIVQTGGLAAYASRVRTTILPELSRAARLKTRFFGLASTPLFTRALDHSPAIRTVMADLIAGRAGYSGLRRRLLRTFEWRLAWQAIRSS
jgi:geranylgeranyl reductase family protein